LRELGVKVADFSTRRRFSFDVQDDVVAILKEYAREAFVGTSNVYFAMKHGVKPIGTKAHELYSAYAAMFGYRMANALCQEGWMQTYGGDLGIALPDTFTTDVFLRTFDKKWARLYDGLRQDSGDPNAFADKVIAHYESLGIDPMTKTIVFSDSLNVDKVALIEKYCRGRIKTAYGIGTNFANDVGHKPLNIVCKLVASAPDETSPLVPCVKLSDVPGKHTGDPEEIALCKRVLGIET